MKINPILKTIPETSNLYHLGINLTQQELDKFRNIKFVIMQGSPQRTEVLARKLARQLLQIDQRFFTPLNLSTTSDYAVYRVGNVLAVSHGMGNVTIDTLLHSITKLLYFAGNTELEYIRVGTCGGLGVESGTVIITKDVFMPNLEPYYSSYELDKEIKTPTTFDDALIQRIVQSQPHDLAFPLLIANSIAADDFYLGQCRYDGAMASTKNQAQRLEFFAQAQELGIYSFEMESSALAAFCCRAQIPATMVAVALLNRYNGDQVKASATQLAEFAEHAQQVVINYLQSKTPY